MQAASELGQPGFIGARQGQGEGKGQRRSAHGSQITGGNGQRTLTEKKGIAGFGEMHPGDQGVGGNRQLLVCRQLQQCAVITNAQHHAGLARWLTDRYAIPLWMTHGEFFTMRALGERLPEPAPEGLVLFHQRAGMSEERIARMLAGLRKDLTEAQVDKILDLYTIGKYDFTLKGFKAIVPDMTADEEQYVIQQLRLAREQAASYKTIKGEMSAIFEIYKDNVENYFNNNGRNWRQMYKTYVDKLKAEKKKKEE